jgi:hypothetical protein
MQSGSVVLKASSKPKVFLGGLPEGVENTISKANVYGRLPRPANLSPPPFRIDNKDDRKTFQRIWDGDFVARYDSNLIVAGEKCFFVCAQAPDSQDIPARFRGCDVVSFFLALDGNSPNRIAAVGVITKSQSTKEFWARLTHDAEQALSYRIAHLFIRDYGFLLPEFCFHAVAGILLDHYGTHSNYQESIDVAMIKADLAFNMNRTDSGRLGGAILDNVGEYLEAKGQFSEAANLYRWVAEEHYKVR